MLSVIILSVVMLNVAARLRTCLHATKEKERERVRESERAIFAEGIPSFANSYILSDNIGQCAHR